MPGHHPPNFDVKVMARGSNNGLVVWLSIIAGLQSLSGAAVITEVLSPALGGAFVALVGALSAGTAVYVAGTKPIEDSPAGQTPHVGGE